ncbi:hypothetical protein ACV3J7_07235 [Salmonella enterica]
MDTEDTIAEMESVKSILRTHLTPTTDREIVDTIHATIESISHWQRQLSGRDSDFVGVSMHPRKKGGTTF